MVKTFPLGPIGLMPLTTAGGEDSLPTEGAEGSEDIPPRSPLTMPLTTTGGEDSSSDEDAEDIEEPSNAGPVGLMPLMSKDIDE